MAYEPPSGWVQVTRIKSTGEIFHQRLHGDRTCAEASVRDRIAVEAAKGREVESYLSDHMTYAQARRLKKFSCCKCSGRPGDHKVTPDRPPGYLIVGTPGTGRRR